MRPDRAAEPDQERVLIVAQRPEVRELLRGALARHGYSVADTASGRASLERLGDERPDLLLIDLHLRDVSGLDVLATALEAEPPPAVVMLLEEPDGVRAADCLAQGALDYLIGPFDPAGLERDLGRALRWWRGLGQARRQLRETTEQVIHRTDQLEEALERQERFTVATLEALINVQEAKNPFLAGHSVRVASVSAAVAAEVGLPAFEVEKVRWAGRLHDLGMIGVRERIWDKPTQLTDEEYSQVKQHTVIGARILEPLTHLGPVVDYVHSHHERWDGKGYPGEVAGQDIPLGGRIIHGAEVFDALTTRRSYQEPVSPEEALRRMQRLAKTGLDPEIVDAFDRAIAASHSLPFGRDDVVRRDGPNGVGHPPLGGSAA